MAIVSKDVNVAEILETATYLLGVTDITGPLWIKSLFRRHDDRPWSMRRVRREVFGDFGGSGGFGGHASDCLADHFYDCPTTIQSGGLPEPSEAPEAPVDLSIQRSRCFIYRRGIP